MKHTNQRRIITSLECTKFASRDTWMTDGPTGLSLSFTHASDGTTILTGPVVDQAALYGLLRKVRDLGLPLLSVVQVDPKQANGPDGNADTDHNRSKKETNP